MHNSSTSRISYLKSMYAFFKYNASNIFAGKFVYFLSFSILLFLTIVIIYSVDENAPPSPENIYYFLLFPAVLLVFYPSTYNIQSDVDSRMIETLFGIPDYRYKVWLARNITQQFIIVFIMFGLSLFCYFAMADFSVWEMTIQIMFPLLFLSSLAFMLSTITRSGNATAVIMVILNLFFMIADEILEGTRWNLYLNPFSEVEAFEVFLQIETMMYNRIYIVVASILFMMIAMLRLQKREKFI